MGDCQFCNHDHASAEGWPGGCPFYGSPKAWTRRVSKQLSSAEQLALNRQRLENDAAIAKREREQAAQRREWEWVKTSMILKAELAKYRQARQATGEATMDEVHTLLVGSKYVAAYDERQRVRRLVEKYDRVR